MDRIWAPWRMEYIKQVDKDEGCFLCDISSEGDDREKLILHRGAEAYVIMNRYPYNSGHLMIVPFKHTAEMGELGDACLEEMMRLTGKAMDVLEKKMESQGFNCGMNFGRVAGAGITDHLHMHVVPRWVGDVNFFPVLGSTKSMPEYLEETYDRLVKGF